MNIFENKNVLITGATGLLGTYLVKKLLEFDNCRIIALGRNIQKLKDVFDGYPLSERVILMEGDVAVEFPLINESIDFIFHAASPISGDTIRNNPVNVIKPNIIGTINCLEYLRKEKEDTGREGMMIVFSSATVYANTTDQDVRVTEKETSIADTLDAVNAPYSESKRMAEVIARSYVKQYGINVLIARFGYLYGYSKYAPNTAFYEFIHKSMNGENLMLNSTGAPKRDNIYVEDAIEGLLCLCEKGISGESYNISSGGDKNNFAAIDEIANAIVCAINKNIKGFDVKVSFREKVEGRKPGLMLDNTKLKSLGWSIKHSLTDGVEKTIKAYIG